MAKQISNCTSVFIYLIQTEPQLEGMGLIPPSAFFPEQASSSSLCPILCWV